MNKVRWGRAKRSRIQHAWTTEAPSWFMPDAYLGNWAMLRWPMCGQVGARQYQVIDYASDAARCERCERKVRVPAA